MQHQHAENSHCHVNHAGQEHGIGKISMHATLHCLTGCVIGEVTGLVIGVHYGLGMWPTMILATVLAYVVGFSLAIPPIMKKKNLGFKQTFRAIWLGETISIGVMEVVMNAVDYAVGGVQAASLASPIFYIGIAFAIPAGFLAGWPVNYLLLKNEIKDDCH